jgi:hypothetical protein
MPSATPRWLDRALAGSALALGLALSVPGVRAHAETDLAPSARDLTSLSSPSAAARPVRTAGATCKAEAAMVDPQLAARQRAAMQQLAKAGKADGVVRMNNRGSSYATDSDPMLELMRIQLEARARDPRE